MDILSQFLTFEMLVVCLLICALVFVQRKVAELISPNLKTSKNWREFWLPIGPLGTGGLFGWLAKPYPWPEAFAGHTINRIVIGIVCGLLSAKIYRLVNKNLIDRIRGKSEERPEDQDASMAK